MDSELSEEFDDKVRMHQGSMQSPFLFAVVLNVVTVLARYVSYWEDSWQEKRVTAC